MDIAKIKKEYPNLNVVGLNDSSGCNIYLPGRLILNIWFKKKIYKTNAKKQKFRHFTDDADLLNIIASLGNLKMKKTIHFPPPVEPTGENAGTKHCIEHIKKKLAIVEKVDAANTKGILMLKLLINELEQFL